MIGGRSWWLGGDLGLVQLKRRCLKARGDVERGAKAMQGNGIHGFALN
jgi:hypothetical protein